MAVMDWIVSFLPDSVEAMYKARKAKKLAQKAPETFAEHLWSWVKTLVWAITVVTIVNGLALASFTVPTGSMESTVLAGDFVFVNKFIYGPSTPQIIPFLNMPLPYYKLPALSPPDQGDIIVFIFPGNRDQVEADNFEYYLKRCVAVAGDTLYIRNGHVFVNGKEFPLPEHARFEDMAPEEREMSHLRDRMLSFPPGRGWDRDNWGPLRIPKEGDAIPLTRENIREWATFIMREGHAIDTERMTIDGNPASSYTVERDYVFGMGDNRDNSLDSRFWGFIPEHDVVGTPMIVYWSWDNVDPVLSARAGVQMERSLWEKLKRIRWSRIGTIVR